MRAAAAQSLQDAWSCSVACSFEGVHVEYSKTDVILHELKQETRFAKLLFGSGRLERVNVSRIPSPTRRVVGRRRRRTVNDADINVHCANSTCDDSDEWRWILYSVFSALWLILQSKRLEG